MTTLYVHKKQRIAAIFSKKFSYRYFHLCFCTFYLCFFVLSPARLKEEKGKARTGEAGKRGGWSGGPAKESKVKKLSIRVEYKQPLLGIRDKKNSFLT
jgi:hypothetical protein